MDSTGAVSDIGGLRLLQRQHLLNVPFENLDIHWGQPIVLDTEAFYQKIVETNRGGFCYELNGLFNELLREMGFQTRIVSARVADGHGGYGPEYDHLAVMVIIGETHYLADVGFGDFAAEPLEFRLDIEQQDLTGIFMIRQYRDEYFEVVKKEGGILKSQYIFKPLGRDISEFAAMCAHHQSSPDSHFTKGRVCSILTEDGRKTLTDKKFIVTADGERIETEITSGDEFSERLMSDFGIHRASADSMSFI